MRFAIVLPAAKEWVRLLQVQRRYPHADHICSHRVHPDAKFGTGSAIAEHVVVNAGVSLGDYSYANNGAILFSGTIGRFCSIGHYALIGPEKHPLDHISTAPDLYKGGGQIGLRGSGWNEYPEPPLIGNDVWIGSRAVVLQGVTIGDGAVIAAGAVVTRDVDPYQIVAGIPAKVIRTRFDQEKIDLLLTLRWWDLPVEQLRARFEEAFVAGSSWREHM